MKRRRWSDLSARKRTLVSIASAVQFALLVAALYDLRRRPPELVNGSKRFWRAAAFVNFVGPVAYFVVGRKRQEPEPAPAPTP